jgi:hypothetical protein
MRRTEGGIRRRNCVGVRDGCQHAWPLVSEVRCGAAAAAALLHCSSLAGGGVGKCDPAGT